MGVPAPVFQPGRVTVVIPAYRSAGVIGACLAAARAAGADRVVVVDNASPDETAAVAGAAGATVLRQERNGGFGAACNRGLAAVETDFAVLLNPDAELAPDALAELLAAADRYPDAGLLGPLIRGADGTWEPSHNVALPDRRAIQRRRGDPQPEGDLCASFLSGAVLLVRMAAHRAVGGFDERIFLYYEDDDLCLRHVRAGWSLVLAPAAACIHQGGASSGGSRRIAAIKHRHMAWSRLYFASRHEGGAARMAWAALARHGLKSALYGLTGAGDKYRRHQARLAGTLDWLTGRRPPTPEDVERRHGRSDA